MRPYSSAAPASVMLQHLSSAASPAPAEVLHPAPQLEGDVFKKLKIKKLGLTSGIFLEKEMPWLCSACKEREHCRARCGMAGGWEEQFG